MDEDEYLDVEDYVDEYDRYGEPEPDYLFDDEY